MNQLHDWNELLDWLRNQKGGVGTYTDFQNRALALRSVDTRNAALARLLADLAGRFADAYDGEPLSVGVANEALARLTSYVEKAVQANSASPEEQLALLNEIGLAELAEPSNIDILWSE
jgi:hypothetical protein